MTERIKDFAKQAKEHAEASFPDHTKFNHSENWHAAYHEKFAELIIQECAMIVEGFEITQEVALDEYVDYEASTVLKDHFGVK